MDLVNTFKSTTDRAARRRIRAEVVAAFRPMVTRAVRGLVPAADQKGAEQVGMLGLLVALEKYDPAAGVAFERAAIDGARAEVARAFPQSSVGWVMEEVEIESGRQFTVEIKSADGRPASPAEFSAAFDRAKGILLEPVE